MEFKDKAVDAEYAMLRDREYSIECDLDEIRQRIADLIDNNEQE